MVLALIKMTENTITFGKAVAPAATDDPNRGCL